MVRMYRSDIQVSVTRRIAPEDTMTTRDLDATSFSVSKCVR